MHNYTTANAKEEVPEHYLDPYTEKLMENPFIIIVGNKCITVDETSIPKNYQGVQDPDEKLKKEIEEWKKTHPNQPIKPIPSPKKADYHFKILVVGNSGVGKTALTSRFVNGEFSEHYPPNGTADSMTKQIDIKDKSIELQIWHAHGSKNDNFYNAHMKGADVVIYVFDVNDSKSFENVDVHRMEVEIQNPCIPIKMLVGNKIDKEHQRAISEVRAKKYASENGMEYAEDVSAKEYIKVKELFLLATHFALGKAKENKNNNQTQEQEIQILKSKENPHLLQKFISDIREDIRRDAYWSEQGIGFFCLYRKTPTHIATLQNLFDPIHFIKTDKIENKDVRTYAIESVKTLINAKDSFSLLRCRETTGKFYSEKLSQGLTALGMDEDTFRKMYLPVPGDYYLAKHSALR